MGFQNSPKISFTVLLNGAHSTKLFAHVDLRYPLRWENFDWNDFRMISWTKTHQGSNFESGDRSAAG
jgi:hypothetical protein